MRCSTGLKTRYTAALRTCFVWPIIEGVGVKNWCHIMLAEKDIGARGWVGLVYNTKTNGRLCIKWWFHVNLPELWYSIQYPGTTAN